MRYGLDSSVGFKWFVREADSDQALRLRDAYRGGIHELLSRDKPGSGFTIASILLWSSASSASS